MTLNDKPASPATVQTAVRAFIAAMRETSIEYEIHDHLWELEAILTPQAWAELCNSLDVCPIHRVDISVCDDDNAPECAKLR